MKSSIITLSSLLCLAQAQTQSIYGQCGGQGWTGPTQCTSGTSCVYQNPYYSQCLPGQTTMQTIASTPEPSAPPPSSTAGSGGTPAPSATGSPSGGGKVQVAGVNIAGCDFGCSTDGTCTTSGADCPTSVGPAQMSHFASDDGLNIFRLPVGWQSLVNNQLSGTLDPTFMSTYDGIMQSCLGTGARCIIDIHNYARWNGGIVGQGGPTNDDLANVWQQLATKYASEANVVFGIMNEPHDLDMPTWAATVQESVTAIRNAGASTQWILLPGTDYTSAGGFEINSAPALSSITNPDGTTTGLVYDVHRYYDSDGSGTSTDCVTDHIDDSYAPLATYLRSNGRQALLSENGGGNNQGCVTDVCNALDYLNSNSDVYLGWIGWAAGSFDSSYALSEVPSGSTDTLLVSSCIAGQFK